MASLASAPKAIFFAAMSVYLQFLKVSIVCRQ